jgi:hypothetical protein
MATPSTADVVHPEIALAAEPQQPQRRRWRLLRRRERRPRRALHSRWREEATVRAMTRRGAPGWTAPHGGTSTARSGQRRRKQPVADAPDVHDIRRRRAGGELAAQARRVGVDRAGAA